MELHFAICEDDSSEASVLSEKVKLWARLRNLGVKVFVFSSAEAFLFEFDGNQNFDLLLLDIEMGGMDGLSLARELRRRKSDIEIVFVTTHVEFYGEGYDVDALHYLIKPVNNEKLFSVLDRAKEKLDSAEPPVIISSGGETVRLAKKDILYAEAFLHYISIHTEKNDYRIKESIGDFEARLGDGFFRCHRSYIVSLCAITRISRNAVTVSNGVELPLSRGKYDEINRAYIQYYS